MPAPPLVRQLVDRFAEQIDDYRAATYNETALRRDFLDPFFGVGGLGWDVHNEQGWAEAYRQVIHEYAIKIGAKTKAPDYCFRVGGGQPTFFVEAKKPAVDIATHAASAYQLRRYAWSAKLPVSILTDFEELAVYDCRIRPVAGDKPSTARILYLRYDEYEARWEELAGLFSPDAIRRGALDKFIASKKVKKGTAEVDDAFLADIEKWRDLLARNLALRNQDAGLSQRDLNFAVQRTIDRIVFLRICEDRGIEPYGRLHTLLNGGEVYRRLTELFRRADERYNSGLFHFTKEKDRPEPPDEMTLALSIDDKTLKDIIRGLYYPESPYEFSVLPAEILGHVYEQFLGKVIRLTKGGQAKVEEKPEVRKAGGVYYTPSYIVDYIVEHTVGKLLQKNIAPTTGRGKASATNAEKGTGTFFAGDRADDATSMAAKNEPVPKPIAWKTPRQVARLRVVDPACGSGSFLIGAYQYLLNWYRDRYVEAGPAKAARGKNPKLYQDRTGQWRLTTAERKRILLAHIYGVDIDPQAVEVTKLSLLLKVLEGENKESLQHQRRLFHERALPDLAANIQCGNSLIGPDFYEGRQMSLLDEEEMYRINVFDWEEGFPEVFKGDNPGFDAVIGNPPYLNIRLLTQTHGSEVKDYFADRFWCAFKGYDLYVLFIEAAFEKAKTTGVCGLIVPNKFASLDYARKCRTLLKTKTTIRNILDVSELRVFSGASVYPHVIVFESGAPAADHTFSVTAAKSLPIPVAERVESRILQSELDPGTGFFLHGDISVESRVSTRPLETFAVLHSGTTGFAAHATARHLMDDLSVDSPAFEFIVSGNIDRYIVTFGNVRYMNKTFRRPRLPVNADVLTENKRRLFTDEKIVIAGMTKRIEAAYDPGGAALGVQVYAAADMADHSMYLLGLLNSALLSYLFRLRFQAKHLAGGFLAINKGQLQQLPIRVIDSSSDAEVEKQRAVIAAVERMCSLCEKRLHAKSTHETTVFAGQITATDREIDRLVYELYELTDDEIRIVEDAMRRE